MIRTLATLVVQGFIGLMCAGIVMALLVPLTNAGISNRQVIGITIGTVVTVVVLLQLLFRKPSSDGRPRA